MRTRVHSYTRQHFNTEESRILYYLRTTDTAIGEEEGEENGSRGGEQKIKNAREA